MFDLEYYNEIIDYGKLVDKIMEERRQLYNIKKNKKQLIDDIEYNNNRLIVMDIFNRKHTFAYINWYDNYYNKLPIKSLKTTWTDEYYKNIPNRLNKLH